VMSICSMLWHHKQVSVVYNVIVLLRHSAEGTQCDILQNDTLQNSFGQNNQCLFQAKL
jgi:hypothetical protein